MRLIHSLALSSIAGSAAVSAASWPYGPLVTDGRWIVNSNGEHVTYAGANWPGAADTMLPEGLQYASIESTMSKIKSIGMNAIRLTFAIELVDQIYENGGVDITIADAFTEALGSVNGSAVLQMVLANNPSFTENTTRLQVFDAVAAGAAAQEIYVHLDNHISLAEWCCNTGDGNSWFGDTYFNVSNWRRGLAHMADHASSWTGFVSMGMRNELRQPDSPTPAEPYDWSHWYSNMVPAAEAINAANPDPLIFFSGLGFDTNLAPVTLGSDLGGNQTFDISSFSFPDKIVFELHNYQNEATNCSAMENSLYNEGYNALDTSNTTVRNHAPVVMTEFGFGQDNSTYMDVYATCLRQYLPSLHAGWLIWTLSGSYYIRSGTQDYDDTWGLLTHDWSSWRSPAAMNNGLIPMINATLA